MSYGVRTAGWIADFPLSGTISCSCASVWADMLPLRKWCCSLALRSRRDLSVSSPNMTRQCAWDRRWRCWRWALCRARVLAHPHLDGSQSDRRVAATISYDGGAYRLCSLALAGIGRYLLRSAAATHVTEFGLVLYRSDQRAMARVRTGVSYLFIGDNLATVSPYQPPGVVTFRIHPPRNSSASSVASLAPRLAH